jgi:hypothetical protein
MKNAETGLLIFLIVAIVVSVGFNCENKPTPISVESVWPAYMGAEYVVTVYQDTIGTFELQSFDPDVGWYFRDGLTITVK